MFENLQEVPRGLCESSTDWVESGHNSNVPSLDVYLRLTDWEFVTARRCPFRRFAFKGYESQIGQEGGVCADRGAIGLRVTWRACGRLALRTPALNSVAGGSPTNW